jgi:hypothetical protein
MSNPTSNFGWQMPTATDLVTDLPADFEVFGQAVDTDFVDLLGGTTGQILSKTSATDLDFTWIANDQGDITGVTAGNGITVTSPTGPVPTVAINTAITADLTTAQTLTNKTLTSPALTTPTISTLTTNGDLLYGTGSGALARKAIGSTGQVLTVAAGIPAWATPSSGPTYVGANVFNTTLQTISSGVTTVITFDSERNDTNTFHSTSVNTGRITIPSSYGGKYQIRCQLTWASGALGNLFLTLRKNGTDIYTQPAYSLQMSIMMQEDLVATDYLDLTVFQNTGGNINVSANGTSAQTRQEFSVIYLGA